MKAKYNLADKSYTFYFPSLLDDIVLKALKAKLKKAEGVVFHPISLEDPVPSVTLAKAQSLVNVKALMDIVKPYWPAMQDFEPVTFLRSILSTSLSNSSGFFEFSLQLGAAQFAERLKQVVRPKLSRSASKIFGLSSEATEGSKERCVINYINGILSNDDVDSMSTLTLYAYQLANYLRLHKLELGGARTKSQLMEVLDLRWDGVHVATKIAFMTETLTQRTKLPHAFTEKSELEIATGSTTHGTYATTSQSDTKALVTGDDPVVVSASKG